MTVSHHLSKLPYIYSIFFCIIGRFKYRLSITVSNPFIQLIELFKHRLFKNSKATFNFVRFFYYIYSHISSK